MEARNITIVSTQNQRKTVISTDATTLRELKNALDTQGVEYEGMTFYEGLSHTELLTDDSILPHDVPYKGTVTNELVFMLTSPNKKIKSGANLPEARQALYDTIVEMGLQDACVSTYSKNFTQCKNSELMALIENAQAAQVAASPAENNCAEAIKCLVNILFDGDILNDSEVNEVLSVLDGPNRNASVYSDSEIDEMFRFVNE